MSFSLHSLESPTRSLFMEAPKGVQIKAEAGDFQATCRSDLRLESKDGEVNAPTLPQTQAADIKACWTS